MSGSTATKAPRRRAVALSSAIAMFTLSGLTSMAAYASNTITVTATVEECVISVTNSESIDLGDNPTFVTTELGTFYEFESMMGISVEWSAGEDGTPCAGSLYVARGNILKNGDGAHVDTAQIYLGFGGADVTVTTDARDTGALETPSNFDVTMKIPVLAGPGTYSTTLTFTVVVDG